jgi:hypothetical protein
MRIKGQIHEFNTGRRYTKEGQRIRWAIIEEVGDGGPDIVAFEDLDRGIFGCIPKFLGNDDLINDAWVLRAYDDHHWHEGFAAYEAKQLLR